MNTDLFSLMPSYKIHFHNGLLKTCSFKNHEVPWQFCNWPDLKEDFPIYAWIQSHLAKTKNEIKILKNQGLGQTEQNHRSSQNIFPSMGYALFVPKPKNHNKKKPILHIHFSFNPRLDGETVPATFLPNRDSALTKRVDHKVEEIELTNRNRIHIKNFIFLEEGAELTLIENFELLGEIKQAVRSTTYVQSEPHSSLNWLHVSQGEENSSLSCETYGDIKYKASINRLSLALSEGTSKDFVTVRHTQREARSILLSLALLKQKAQREQKWDTRLEELEAYCRQYFKGILNNRAKSTFHGKVHISPQSAQADCVQSAKSFFLSEQAHSLMNPEMEVHCGEVKAKHGATTGQLNKDEMFYLQSRGLPEATAFEMLIMAHIKDILHFFPDQYIKDKLLQNIQKNKKKYLNY